MKKTSLGGDAVKLTFSKTLTLCISTATGMILSRFCTLDEYGTYSSLLLVINLLASLLMLGLPNSINFFLARADSDEERSHFLSVYYTANTLLSFIIGLLLVLAVPLIERYFENDLISSFWYVLAVYPWASIIAASVDNFLVIYQKVDLLMLCKLIFSASILLGLLAVKFLGLGFSEYMIVFVVINGLYAVMIYLMVSRIGKNLKPAFDRELMKKILAFSVPIGLSSMVGTLSIEIDKLLIGWLMDTDRFAIYTNAAKELPLTIVASSITAVLLPRAAALIKHGDIEKAVRLWKISTELSFIVIALFTVGIFTYAEDVVTFLYSSKYLPGVGVFRVYTLILLIRCTYFGLILNSTGETKKILLCSILNLVINAALNPVFYLMFGMIGPAIATFVSILLLSFLMLGFTSKVSGIGYSKVFPWKMAAVTLLVNAGFAAAFYFLKKICPLQGYVSELGESIILGVIWAGLYFLIMKKRIAKDWRELNRE